MKTRPPTLARSGTAVIDPAAVGDVARGPALPDGGRVDGPLAVRRQGQAQKQNHFSHWNFLLETCRRVVEWDSDVRVAPRIGDSKEIERC